MRLHEMIAVAAMALVLAACASSKEGSASRDDPFFSLKFAPQTPTPIDDFPPRGDAEAFTLHMVIERADQGRFAAPIVTAFAGQTANVSVLNEVPYLVDSRDGPVTKKADDGLRVECAMRRAADGGVTIGYSIRLTRVEKVPESEAAGGAVVKPRMPDIDRVEVSGVRRIEPGVQGLLARVPSPDGSGPMLILARVDPTFVEAPPAGVAAENFGDTRLGSPMTGPTRHLRISVSEVGRDLEPGTVLDETATPDVLKAAGGAILRDFECFTCLDARVRLAGLLDTIGGTRGFVAQFRDDGRFDLEWTTTEGTRRATLRPSAGRRFVALARIEGGGTAGVLVSLDAD